MGEREGGSEAHPFEAVCFVVWWFEHVGGALEGG